LTMFQVHPSLRLSLLTFTAAVTALLAVQTPAAAQSDTPALFVSNNGNLEGSVSAFRVDANGELNFVNRVVTGSRPQLSDPCPGCNAYEISLTPDGRHLVTIHPAGDLDGISFLRVNPDASVTLLHQFTFPVLQDGPLDVIWLDNEYVAAAMTGTNPDSVWVWRFDPDVPSMTFAFAVTAGSNSLGYLALHPSGNYLYGNDSSGNRLVRTWSIGPGGSLTLIDSEFTGAPFALELAVSHNGNFLYGAGGISDGGNKVVGMTIQPDGTLTLMPNSPFVSPGASPSNVFLTGDDTILIAGHGTDATVRTFLVDSETGTLTATPHMFDVGLQGTLGDVRTMGDFMFVTDNSTAIDGLTGVYSFKIGPDGSLNMNGPGIYLTGGIAPRSLATWVPQPTLGDLNCDNVVNLDDIDPFVLALIDPDVYDDAYPDCDITWADTNGDTMIDGQDVAMFITFLVD
jgi:6-phosphogluconolactonase (cycloisomerase 2 family)